MSRSIEMFRWLSFSNSLHLGFGDYFWQGNHQSTPSFSFFRISWTATGSLMFHVILIFIAWENGFSDVENFWSSDSLLEVHLRKSHKLWMVLRRVLLTQSSIFPRFGFRQRGLERLASLSGEISVEEVKLAFCLASCTAWNMKMFGP